MRKCFKERKKKKGWLEIILFEVILNLEQLQVVRVYDWSLGIIMPLIWGYENVHLKIDGVARDQLLLNRQSSAVTMFTMVFVSFFCAIPFYRDRSHTVVNWSVWKCTKGFILACKKGFRREIERHVGPSRITPEFNWKSAMDLWICVSESNVYSNLYKRILVDLEL